MGGKGPGCSGGGGVEGVLGVRSHGCSGRQLSPFHRTLETGLGLVPALQGSQDGESWPCRGTCDWGTWGHCP